MGPGGRGPGGPGGWGPLPGGPPGFGPGPGPFGCLAGICDLVGSCLSCLCCCWLFRDCFGGPLGPGGPPGPGGPRPF
uniref:Uncharacterized protein n=1 Tax=Kalanchoe fedtschenkoi TaxID=63787 RepID=A0A7N0UL48_KALFE